MPDERRALSRLQSDRDGSWRLLPWWWAIIATLMSIAAGVVAVVLLWLVAGKSASLRIEAIKVGLSVTAGIGGAWALLLAFRRQMHNEAVAQDTSLDATQRRLTELYAKGVEQLGHAEAAVRLGGLFALERLAQENPEYRQTIIDVVCAYLRMAQRKNEQGSRDDSEVRAAGQDLLRRHSADPELYDDTDEHWFGMRIDLHGAVLINADFSCCRFYETDFRGVFFGGDARFTESSFTDVLRFEGARFGGGAYFNICSATGEAYFERVNITGEAWFSHTEFREGAYFEDAYFGQDLTFRGFKTAFLIFSESRIAANADFREMKIDSANFDKARFNGPQPDFTGTVVEKPKETDQWPYPWSIAALDDTGKSQLVISPER